MHARQFHLSLPPFRAALVPWWAMAPRSAREAFLQDLQFHPQPLKCESVLPEILFGRCRSCQAQLKEGSSFLRSEVQVEWVSQHFALRSEAHENAASATNSFTNNCNPLLLTSASAGHSGVLVASDNPAENTINTKQTPCPSRYARRLLGIWV